MELGRELIKLKKEGNIYRQVWWLPSIYWKIALSETDYFKDETINEIITLIDKYNIFIVVNAEMGIDGIKKKDIKTVKITIKGKKYNSLKDIPDELTVLINALKPTLSNILGEFGKTIEVFVFDNTNKNKLFADKKGEFTIKVNQTKFRFALPLSSLVKKKKCPVDNELLSGNWKFCPWHGTKLEQ